VDRAPSIYTTRHARRKVPHSRLPAPVLTALPSLTTTAPATDPNTGDVRAPQHLRRGDCHGHIHEYVGLAASVPDAAARTEIAASTIKLLDQRDGRTDPAIYRPADGYWWIPFSATGYATCVGLPWGVASDVPVPADYDGDGRADPAIFRPADGYWWLLFSESGHTTAHGIQWGGGFDRPVSR
jgi:hypothetical protein